MDYVKILDFDNQRIVDGLYNMMKSDEVNEDLENAYSFISDRNKDNKIKNTFTSIKKIELFVDTFFNIITTLFTTLLIFIGGGFILSVGSLLFVYSIESSKGFQDMMSNIGNNIINKFIPLDNPIVNEMLTTNVDVNYILGFTWVLFWVFVVLFITSMFKKKKKRRIILNDEDVDVNDKDCVIINLDKVYYYLKITDDDSWEYIKKSLSKRLNRVSNRSLYDIYYGCFVYYSRYYNEVEGDVKTLTVMQKISLAYHTLTNTIVNIVGLLGKPFVAVFFIILAYYRLFGDGFKLFLTHESPIQQSAIALFEFLKKIDSFVQMTPFAYISNIFTGETVCPLIPEEIANLLVTTGGETLKVFVSLVLFVSIFTMTYNLIFKRIEEIKCQYTRRLNFYAKVNSGAYESKKKYKGSHTYYFEFTIVVFFILALVFLTKL